MTAGRGELLGSRRVTPAAGQGEWRAAGVNDGSLAAANDVGPRRGRRAGARWLTRTPNAGRGPPRLQECVSVGTLCSLQLLDSHTLFLPSHRIQIEVVNHLVES